MTRTIARPVRFVLCASLLLAGTAAGLGAQESQPDVRLSPGTARSLSALGTLTPIALGLLGGDVAAVHSLAVGGAGLVLGPTLGYLYAGEADRGMKRAAVRAAILGIGAGSAALLCSGGHCNLSILGGAAPSPDLTAPAIVLAAAGVVSTTVLAASDIRRVGRVVEIRNRMPGAVSVRPAYFPESHRAGLLLTWRR